MKSRLPKRYYFIPIVYIILILGFINLHIQDIGGRVMSESVGPVMVRYRQDSGVRQQISGITVSLGGLSTDLSAGVPVEDETGRSDRIPIRSVESSEDGFVLILSRGGRIELTATDGYSGYSVLYHKDPEGSDDFRPVLTFSASPEINIRPVQRSMPLFEIDRDGNRVLLAHNNSLTQVDEGLQLRFDKADRGLMVSLSALDGVSALAADEAGGEAEVEAGEAVLHGMCAVPLPEGADPLAYWFFEDPGDSSSGSGEGVGGNGAASLEMAEDRLGQVIDDMLQFWQSSPGQADGQAATATASEALARGAGVDFGSLQSVADEAAGDASWFTATFEDNILDAEQAYSQRENQFLQETARQISEDPLQLLSGAVRTDDYPGLLAAVVFAGDEDLEAELDRVLGDVDGQVLTNSTAAAGLFVIAVEALDSFPERFSAIAASAAYGYEQVLANISRVDSQLLYHSFSGSSSAEAKAQLVVDPLVQIRVARAMQKYAQLVADGAVEALEAGQSDERAQGFAGEIGNSLLVSALSFADENGALPAEITVSNEGLISSDSRVEPSRIYPFLSENNYFPRVVSLQEELGQNVRMWTSSRTVAAVQRADGLEITFDFETGETHYVVIRGLESFSGMEMYGQSWNGDRRFQNYEVGGWYYDQGSEVFFVKLRHRNNIERLLFLS